MNRISVTHYERRPRSAGNYSLEAIFRDLRERLAEHVDATVRIAPAFSNGLLPRLRILFDAWRYRQEAIHFTGDIHFAAIAARKDRAILTIHDCGGLETQRGLRAAIMKLFWYRLPVSRVAKVTTVSEASKRTIIALTGCTPDKITVIANAVSEHFIPSARVFHQPAPRILQVGTAYNKNIERLAEALKDIPCRLIVVGKLNESQRSAIDQAKIPCENKINLSEAELLEEYKQCDLVAFASTFEGFGMPIIEAQRVGRPVVTSNCSSMPEVAGDAACFVDPFDVASIRAGIQKVIGDRSYRAALIEAGHENAKRFNPNAIAGQYLQLYRDVFGSSNQQPSV